MNSGLFLSIVIIVLVLIIGGIIKVIKKSRTTHVPAKANAVNLNEFEQLLQQIRDNQIKEDHKKVDDIPVQHKDHTDEHKTEPPKKKKKEEIDVRNAIVYESLLNRKRFKK